MSKFPLTVATMAAVAAVVAAIAPAVVFAGKPANAATQPNVVEIRNMKFNPPSLTVNLGATVTWINEDDAPHTVTARNAVFRSAALDTKERFSHTFTSPGEFRYFCTIHPMMVGRIVVTSTGKPAS